MNVDISDSTLEGQLDVDNQPSMSADPPGAPIHDVTTAGNCSVGG